MKKIIMVMALLALVSGCATSSSVQLGNATATHEIKSAALVPQQGNSSAMNEYIQNQLLEYNISPKPSLPAGTMKSDDVDALVTYSDSWRWDIKMYLNAITINLFDASTGDLLATGQWHNSALHGYPDARVVIKKLMDEMFAKIKQKSTAR